VVAAEWGDRGTARAVRGRGSAWEVAEDRAVVVRTCGIPACRQALVARGQARVHPGPVEEVGRVPAAEVLEVAVEAGPEADPVEAVDLE